MKKKPNTHDNPSFDSSLISFKKIFSHILSKQKKASRMQEKGT